MIIFLIGMMGTGKSTVGEILSVKLGLPFVDIDEEIIKIEGMEINKIFKLKGEDYFRLLETKILKKTKNSVCSCGGGTVLNNENLEYIKNNGKSVFLKTKIQELSKRIKNSKTRPLLQGDNKRKQLKKIWKERKSKYLSFANITVQTDDKNPKQIAEEIKAKLYL